MPSEAQKQYGDDFGIKKRTGAQIAEDIKLCSTLRAIGKTIAECHEVVSAKYPDFTLSWDAVRLNCAEAEKRWQAERLAPLRAAKARELERLEIILGEAWQAWQNSKKDVREATRVSGARNEGQESAPILKTIQKTSQSNGDPRYLMVMLQASRDIRALRGLDAPIKIDADISDTSDVEKAKMRARMWEVERIKARQELIKEGWKPPLTAKVIQLPNSADQKQSG